jgi:hypothetical protein
MVYAGIQNVLLAEFPELQERAYSIFLSYRDRTNEKPAAYLIFLLVLKPIVLKLLSNTPQDPLVVRIFQFLEAMAVSEDPDVVTLLWIAILVPLVFDRERIRNAWAIMGPRTQDLAREIAKLRGWENNLPSEANL